MLVAFANRDKILMLFTYFLDYGIPFNSNYVYSGGAWKWSINIVRVGDVGHMMDRCKEIGIEAKYSAGSGWDFSVRI